jgi:HEAT repeat protein
MKERLLGQLSSLDEFERRAAAGRLAEYGDDETIGALVTALGDPVPAVRESAAGSLIAIGGAQVCHRAISLLHAGDARVRNYAIEILEQVGDSDLDALIGLLKDNNRDVRACALDILEFLVETGQSSGHGEDALQPLVRALDDHDVNVAAAAATALGRLGEPGAIPSLVRQLARESWMQCVVIGAISEIGGPRAAAALRHVDGTELTEEARFYLETALRALHARAERAS